MRLTPLLPALALVGCQTTGYQDYANAIARVAEAQASVQREQAQAMLRLAEYGADPTTRTVAVIMLALGSNGNNKANTIVQPPQNEALQWAQVILPSISTLALGYWGYHLGKTQSNNAADVSIAGYGAMNGIANSGFNAVGQFRPIPFDWSTLQPNITTTTTYTNTGNGVIGNGTVDNRVITNP
jgi:hypothetical protein